MEFVIMSEAERCGAKSKHLRLLRSRAAGSPIQLSFIPPKTQYRHTQANQREADEHIDMRVNLASALDAHHMQGQLAKMIRRQSERQLLQEAGQDPNRHPKPRQE